MLMGKTRKSAESSPFKSVNPTIDLIMRAVQHHVLMDKASNETDPAKKLLLEDRAKRIRGDIGNIAYDDALKLVARNGFVAQQAHGWARVAIAQLDMKGSFRFGDVTIEVV